MSSSGGETTTPAERRWRRVETLVESALGHPAAEREAWIERVAADDSTTLRRDALAMLAAWDRVDGFLEMPAAGPRPDDVADSDRVGPYRLLETIGRGGMGTVYRAARLDDGGGKPGGEDVALKLLNRSVQTPSLVRRFHRERQILATLDHPNIARLLDGGTADDGRPYLVMEYVEGTPIDRYCDHRRLGVVARVELVRNVCEAVQHAHQKLLVHRDIKPRNILVTAGGEPKLLDFGIAKLLAPGEFDAELAAETTHAWLVPLTPDYASPEQLQGLPITTASDVYALGVVLYRLLTGRLPLHVSSWQAHEIETFLAREEPLRPSLAVTRTTTADDGRRLTPESVAAARGTTPRRLRRQLAGDLDNIVLAALRKEPHRRYGSAAKLAEDLGRHVAGLPVAARGDALGYRAAKLIRRHRIAVVVASLIATILLAATVYSARQAAAVRAERLRSDRERDKSAAVSAFLVDLLREADPVDGDGGERTVAELLELGAAALPADHLDMPEEMRALLLHTMGSIHRSRGQADAAIELLREAVSLRRARPGFERRDLTESLTELGKSQILKGRYRVAAQIHREALAHCRATGSEPDRRVAENLHYLGEARYWNGDLRLASALLREALAIRRRLLAAGHEPVAKSEAAADLAQSQTLFANIHLELGDPETARTALDEALGLQERFLGRRHAHFARTLDRLAAVHLQRDELELAEMRFREALAIREEIFHSHHPDVSAALNNLARVLVRRGELERAEALTRRALEIARELNGDEHRYAITGMCNLAQILHRQGELDEAESLYRRALEVFPAVLPVDHPNSRYLYARYGVLLLDRGEAAEAEPHLERALTIHRKVVGDDHPDLAENHLDLGRALLALGRLDRAESQLRRGLVLLAGKGPDDPRVRQGRDLLSELERRRAAR